MSQANETLMVRKSGKLLALGALAGAYCLAIAGASGVIMAGIEMSADAKGGGHGGGGHGGGGHGAAHGGGGHGDGHGSGGGGHLWVGGVDTFGTAVGGDMVWVPAGGGRRLDPFGFAAEGYVSSSSQGLLRNARFPTYL